MRILAVNGSPRGAKGNTERILQPFLEGAREVGAETETVYLKDREINHCQGCFTCWTKTPGVCVHQDDMPELLEKIRKSDMVVFATPLYVFTVSGLMKDFMDRMLPLAQPYILRRGDHFIHPPRYPEDEANFVLISNCGFPERHHFSALEETFRRFTDSPDHELAGMICCAGGELLRREPLQERLAWYPEAARAAGRELVEHGAISEETQEVLDRPLVEDPAVYARMANAYWEGMLAPQPAGSGENERDTPLPPPTSQDTMRDLVAGMAMVFDPQAAGDLKAVIQFNVTGDEPEAYYLDIAGGDCRAYEGQHPAPDLTITTPADVWMAISEGELDGQQALMEQKYKASGDFSLLMKLDSLFSAI